jgi:hypothetical protein
LQKKLLTMEEAMASRVEKEDAIIEQCIDTAVRAATLDLEQREKELDTRTLMLEAKIKRTAQTEAPEEAPEQPTFADAVQASPRSPPATGKGELETELRQANVQITQLQRDLQRFEDATRPHTALTCTRLGWIWD